MCDNCETCKMHAKLENDRIESAKDLTLKYIELQKQVAAQYDMMDMQDIKLMEKEINSIHSISEYIRSWSNPAEANDESNDEEKDEVGYFDASPVSQEALEEKLHKVNLLLEKIFADRGQLKFPVKPSDLKL